MFFFTAAASEAASSGNDVPQALGVVEHEGACAGHAEFNTFHCR